MSQKLTGVTQATFTLIKIILNRDANSTVYTGAKQEGDMCVYMPQKINQGQIKL